MRAGGDGESLRGLAAIAASSNECSSCRASQRQQCSRRQRGGSVHRGDVGQLRKDPLPGILLICIYGFIFSLPPKHGSWHGEATVWKRWAGLLQRSGEGAFRDAVTLLLQESSCLQSLNRLRVKVTQARKMKNSFPCFVRSQRADEPPAGRHPVLSARVNKVLESRVQLVWQRPGGGVASGEYRERHTALSSRRPRPPPTVRRDLPVGSNLLPAGTTCRSAALINQSTRCKNNAAGSVVTLWDVVSARR